MDAQEQELNTSGNMAPSSVLVYLSNDRRNDSLYSILRDYARDNCGSISIMDE